MIIGAVADVHGNFDALARAFTRHPDVPYWICVGDLASRAGAYPAPLAPLFWIKGNNENFDRLAALAAGVDPVPNLHYVPNGTALAVGPLTVAGLGGTFAPTWFDTPAADLPARRNDDKRRHFVREEVEACMRLTGVDILMTHEAPRPFILVDGEEQDTERRTQNTGGRRQNPGKPRRRDAGKPAINAVLAAMQPRLHLCGHHHRFVETTREGVRSVCIDRINRSYLLIDAVSLEYEKIDQLPS